MRFGGSILFFVGGIEFVRWRLIADRVAKGWNPAWQLVSTLHEIFYMSLWLGLAAAALMTIIYFLSGYKDVNCHEERSKTESKDASKLTEEELRKLEEEKQRMFEREEKKRLQAINDEQLKQQAEQERQNLLELKRQQLSADDINRSALKDFL